MNDSVHRYRDAINALLLDFQWIEELLRIIIGCSYEILRRSAPPEVTFKPKKGELQSKSLGRLLEKYAEVSRNGSLHNDIKELVHERNFCAHNAFVLTVEEQTAESLEPEISRLEAVRTKSQKCVYALQGEFKALASALHESPVQAANREAPDVNA